MVWMFFFFNPVLGFISGLFFTVFRKKSSYFCLAVSICLIYMYLPMPWDVVHNYNRVFLYPEEGLNLYTYIITIMVYTFGWSYVSVVFLFSVFVAFVYSYSFSRAHIHIKAGGIWYCFFGLLLFLLLYEYRFFLDLQKTTLAIALFILALNCCHSLTKLSFFALSVLIHPLMAGLLAVYAAAKFLRCNAMVLISLYVAALFFSLFFFDVVVDYVITRGLVSYDRIALYLNLQETRYSSESVAFSVRFLRMFSITGIFFVFLVALPSYPEKGVSRRVVLLLCILSIFVSFNEIALERYFYAVYVIAICSVFYLGFNLKWIILIFLFSFANVGAHGFYSLRILFSDSYYYYLDNDDKLNIAARVLYYPTPALLFYELNGASDDFFRNRLEVRE